MAEATGLRNNALPYPVYGAPWTVVFPMLDADGDLVTGATTPDAEVSKNGDTFADCTNESTEIATNSGMYYLSLTATEMTADIVAVIAKSATAGMKTTPIVLYPRKLVTLRSGTVAANAGDGTTLQLDSGASAVDDYYNGCLLIGTLDSNVEARIISDYVGSTKVCTVNPAFVTTPDNNDTFVVYLPEGTQIGQADIAAIGAAAVSTSTAQLGVNAVQAGGTAWGSGAITAGSIASDAITDAKVASDVTIASVTGAVGSVTGAVGSVTGAVGSVTGAVGSVTGNVGGNVTGSVGSVVGAVGSVTGNVGGSVASVVGAVGSVTGNVGGNVTGSVGSIAAGGIANASFAADAITAAKIHADVTTELQSGLATAASLATVAGYLDTEIADILADTNELQTAWADGGRLDLILDARASQTSVDDIPTNAELATALGTADDAVLVQVALIKAKTDSLTFTTANQIDANIQSVKNTAVNGSGTSGDPWGP